MENMLSAVEVIRVANAAAAAQTAVNSDGVPSEMSEGVTFVAAIGAIAGGGTVDMKLQGSDDDGDADAYADLAGTAATQLTDADGNKLLVVEIKRPRKRYVRAVIARGTADSSVDSVVAMRYGRAKQPAVQGATVGSSEVHASPAPGTA